ncbi:MAG: hypothetical protein AAFQ43_15055 [Bacteroidota bacterium]
MTDRPDAHPEASGDATPPSAPAPVPETEPTPEPHDARRQGLGMLRWALGGLAVFLLGATAWIGIRAWQNPDVRLKPQWLPEGQTDFDHSYWTPLLLTVVVGSLIVGWILWRAWTRLRAGEDLYADRFGQGLRRRGETHLTDGDA